MGLRTPASWIQGGSHTAENDRLTERAEIAAAGTVGTNDLAVSAHSTPNMSVDVAAGAAYVKGSITATQGYYKAVSDASVNVAVSAADATNPRIDIVCLTVRDAQYAGANNDIILQVVAGTPAGTPVAPSAPANSYVLAQISVAALATSITNGNITDKRARAIRAPHVFQADVIGASAGRFRRFSSGQTAPILQVEDETGVVIGGFDATGKINAAQQFTYTPVFYDTSGVPPLFSSGSFAGGYNKIGKVVNGYAAVVCGTGSIQGAGGYSFDLPVQIGSTFQSIGTWIRFVGTTPTEGGFIINTVVNSTKCKLVTATLANGSAPNAGDTLAISFNYFANA